MVGDRAFPWQEKFLWNVRAKSGMLSERERLPTLALVYVMRPKGYRERDGQFLLQCANTRFVA
jgi:hypothetical protein